MAWWKYIEIWELIMVVQSADRESQKEYLKRVISYRFFFIWIIFTLEI